MRSKTTEVKITDVTSNVRPIRDLKWPLGMVFDGGAADIELLRITFLPDEFIKYVHNYLDLIKQLKSGKQSLYKVQIVEAQMKEFYVPRSSEGEVLFYVDELCRDNAPLNANAAGFSRKVRSVSKLS